MKVFCPWCGSKAAQHEPYPGDDRYIVRAWCGSKQCFVREFHISADRVQSLGASEPPLGAFLRTST